MNKSALKFLLACALSMPWIAFGDSGVDPDFCAELRATNAEMATVIASIKQKKQGDAAFLRAMASSQKAWQKHVQAELAMQFPSSNLANYGSVLPMCQCVSALGLTQARVATLKQWLEPLEEGDVCVGSKR
ncbi:MAG TPA: lysozyme inhibitor LprI family protein [Limnobacter sp.]|nr:lysozyme inhibitor LprI family protein [Limnobacter sp.]